LGIAARHSHIRHSHIRHSHIRVWMGSRNGNHCLQCGAANVWGFFTENVKELLKNDEYANDEYGNWG
jgi:hypothetical protein